MNTNDTRQLLDRLMSEHGLTAEGWTVGTCLANGDPENFCGRTIHADKVVWFESSSIEKLDSASVRDVILHEIAHALVGPTHGHDDTWRAKALEIGVSAECMELNARILKCQETTNEKKLPENH